MSSIWAASRLAVKGHFSQNQGSRKSVVYTIQSATENLLQALKRGVWARRILKLTESWTKIFSCPLNESCLHIYPAIAGFWVILGLRTLHVAMLSYGMIRACSFMLQYPESWQRHLWTYMTEFPSEEPSYNRTSITIMLAFCTPTITLFQQSPRSRHFFQNMLHLSNCTWVFLCICISCTRWLAKRPSYKTAQTPLQTLMKTRSLARRAV